MTSTSDVYVIRPDDFELCAADAEFGIYPQTGSTNAVTATIDVVGFVK
jgi:hypothetical protein